MKINSLLPTRIGFVVLVLSLLLPLTAAERIPWQKALFGDPAEILQTLRDQLDQELKENGGDTNKPSVALSSAMVGSAAMRAGNHEEAIEHLESGLKTLSEDVWKDVELRTIEYQLYLSFAKSLAKLDRTHEAIKIFELLLERTQRALKKDPAAKHAEIFGYGKADGVDLQATLAKEDWLVELNEGLGILALEQKDWAVAEKFFQVAGDLLKRISPNQIAKADRLQRAREVAAHKQGKAIRPLLVGRSSNPYTFQILGAKTFTRGHICSALARSHDFVRASHPEAVFEEFLSATQACIVRGYQSVGFPDTSVIMTWDESSASVVVTIVEGQRFRAGDIRIKYSDDLADASLRKLPENELRTALTYSGAFGEGPDDRANLALNAIVDAKRLLESQVQKARKEAFPNQANEAEKALLLSGFEHSSAFPNQTKWQQGHWLDFGNHFQDHLGRILQSALAAKGLFTPDFKLTYSHNPKSGTSDLVISIQSEGRPFHLGQIKLIGNRINTDEGLLGFLNLKEGMILQGKWIEDLERKLYHSGRFIGWTFTPRLAPNDRPDQVDLLIHLEEAWSAPPLSEDLTPEQEALLRVIDWINGKAGTQEDFVFDLTIKHPSGPLALKLALNTNNIALSITGFNHETHLFMKDEHEIEILAFDESGSFHANAQIDVTKFLAYFNLLRQPKASPFLRTGSINFGLGFHSLGLKPGILIDPGAALEMEAMQPVIKEGILSLKYGPMITRFDAVTGQFITMEIEGGDGLLVHPVVAKMEVGAVMRTRKELREKIDKTDNWLTDKKNSALALHSLFHGWELFQLFGEDDALELSPEAFIDRAQQRAKRREPLAVFLAEVTSTLWNADKAGGANQSDHEFLIPIDGTKNWDYSQTGLATILAVNLGIFDTFTRHLEPGSWPEKVMREIMSIGDGNTIHSDKTRERLLADQKMGPIGSLVCAELLSKIGHPGAFDFLAKAEEDLNEKGFEKDWSLLLSSPDGFEGIGWKVLQAFQKLRGPEIDSLLPDKSSLFHKLAMKAARITPINKHPLLRPTMNTFWKEDGRDLVRQRLISIRKKLLSRWDPEKVAAVVNGLGVPRAAVNLERQRNITNQPNILGMNTTEISISSMLMAQEIWKTGQQPIPAIVEKQTEAFIGSLGGWEKVKETGFSREGLSFWTGVMISQNAEVQRVFQKQLVSEREARQFFESSPALKNQKFVHAHIITLQVNNNLNEQQKKAEEIRQRIIAATRGKLFKQKALKEAFVREAKEHSMDLFGQKGGCLGWKKESEYSGPIGDELAKIKNGALSEVITIETPQLTAVYLILIPDARRPVPFEQLTKEAVLGAYLDRLFSKSQIYRLPKLKPIDPNQKPPENKALKNLERAVEQLMAELDFATRFPAFNKAKESHPFAKLPQPEQAIRGAAQGRPDDLYRLGTYAERGISPRKNGMPEALRLYREAAEKGEADAMLRLAELHRIGRGVDRDPVKYREWRERGSKAREQQ